MTQKEHIKHGCCRINRETNASMSLNYFNRIYSKYVTKYMFKTTECNFKELQHAFILSLCEQDGQYYFFTPFKLHHLLFS